MSESGQFATSTLDEGEFDIREHCGVIRPELHIAGAGQDAKYIHVVLREYVHPLGRCYSEKHEH